MVYPVALRKESCKLFEKSHIDVSANIVYVIDYYAIFYCIARLPMSRQPFIQVSPPQFSTEKSREHMRRRKRVLHMFF